MIQKVKMLVDESASDELIDLYLDMITQRVHFNPRTREGCDVAKLHSISTSIDFNPRTREGCDSRYY